MSCADTSVLGLGRILSTRRRVVTAVVMLCASVAVAKPTIAQEATLLIKAVDITGVSGASRTYAADVAGVRAGQPFDAAVLDAAVDRLLRTGRFLSARWARLDVEDGVRITLALRERTVVSAIRFSGAAHFSETKLLGQVPQQVNQPLDWFAVRDGQEAVLAMYRDAGYSDVKISYNREEVDRTGELVYTIDEGRRTRVREINFSGNATFPTSELKRQIETKTAWWPFRTGALDADRLEADTVRVQGYHRDQGFLDARVTARAAVISDGDLRVTFEIEEGERYRVEEIRFDGNTVFDTAELLAAIATKTGEFVKPPRVEQDVRILSNKYGELGYIYATARASRLFSDTPGLVRVTFTIDEGEQFRVGRVVVRGNARTKDKVVRRVLNLYPPDDLFNLPEAREAERRLVESRVFSSARVIPVGDEPGVRDAVIDVQESEKMGDLLFAVGVTSNSGLAGAITLDLQNFDIQDWPRSLGEFLRFRSFFGAGQRMRVELQPGREFSRFRVDFTEPFLFDRPLRFDASVYLFQRGRDGYNESRMGGSVSLGKRFERGLLRGWSGELALQVENVVVDDLDLFAARRIRRDEGHHFLASVKGSLVRDRTDSRFLPSTGDRLRLSYEQFGLLGGEDVFGSATVGYSWYKTLATDLLDRKTVLQLRAEGGAIVGDAPVFERFYAGGIGSMRGFKFRGIGEREGLDDNNVGGDYLVLLGAEYGFPLYGDNVRGHFFLDTGTAGQGTYRAALGFGMRMTINVLGPLPLEFNIAIPVSSDGGDDEQVFSFVIGGLF